MTPEEKNNHYHNILSILKNKQNSEQNIAKDILLYLESAINQKEMEIEERKELYGGDGAPSLPLPRFGKTFRRAT